MSLHGKCYKPNKVEFSLGSGNKFFYHFVLNIQNYMNLIDRMCGDNQFSKQFCII